MNKVRGPSGRCAFWRDGKIDVAPTLEPLDFRRRDWNCELDELRMWYRSDCRKASDSVQFSANEVENKQGKGFDYVKSQWTCVEEEEWQEKDTNREMKEEKQSIAPSPYTFKSSGN